jgi:hypothetical protein
MLAGQTGLNPVCQLQPVLAGRRRQTSQRTEDLLPRTLERAYRLDQEIVVIRFSLVRLGRLADVHRTLYTSHHLLNAIQMLILIRHYFAPYSNFY